MVDEVEFVSVEQFFQYTKAISCHAEHLARKIKSKSNPWYAKAVGKRVETTEEWHKTSMQMLYRGVYAKFDQNCQLKQALLQTAGQNLYEATTDPHWGCGIDITSPKWESGDWDGNNVGGKIVMKVREEFLREESLGHSNTNDNTLANLFQLDSEATGMEWQHNTSSSSSTNISRRTQPPKPLPQRLPSKNARATQGITASKQEWPLPRPDSQSQPLPNSSPKPLSRSYTDVVKSPESTPNSQRGRGSNKNTGKTAKGRGKSTQWRKPGQREQLSQQDEWFLQGKNNPGRRQSGHGPKSHNKPSAQNPNQKPKKDWSNSLNLSQTQREAINYLGLEPDCEFVRSIVSTHSKK